MGRLRCRADRRRCAQRPLPSCVEHVAALMTWLRTISAPAWTVLAACGVELALALLGLQGRPRDYDEGVYWQSLRAMADGHLLFSSVFSSQPPLFLLSVYPFYLLFGQSIVAARLALVIFSVAGIIGAYVVGRALGHRAIGAVACMLLALDPFYVKAAYSLQAEMPSIVLQIWAVACAALSMHVSGSRRGWLAFSAGILLGCASLMKLFAIASLVPVVILLCAPFFAIIHDNRRGKQTTRELILDALRKTTPSIALLAAGCLVAVIVTLVPFIGRLSEVYDQVVRFHLVAGQFAGHSMVAQLVQITEWLTWGPLFYIAVLAMVGFPWHPIWASVAPILWALSAFVVLLHVQPPFIHHVVLLSPALALISGCGAVIALRELKSSDAKRRRSPMAFLVLLAVAGTAGLFVNLWQIERVRRPPSASELDMVTAIRANTAPGDVVLSDNQFVAALADRDVPPQMVDTSRVRIMSGYLTTEQLKDLITHNQIPAVLFATGRFDALTGFRAWVEQRYALAPTSGNQKSLFLLNSSNAR